MNNIDIMKNWLESADEDYSAMMLLYENKKYMMCLYIGHLIIEKILKAFYAKMNPLKPYAPYSHDLRFLAHKIGIILTEEQDKQLEKITEFNKYVGYDDYEGYFYNQCTDIYTRNQINNVKEFREWLINMLVI